MPYTKIVVTDDQGRYFLPLALVTGIALPAFGSARWMRWRHALILAVIAFPVVTLGTVMRAIAQRYYLG